MVDSLTLAFQLRVDLTVQPSKAWDRHLATLLASAENSCHYRIGLLLGESNSRLVQIHLSEARDWNTSIGLLATGQRSDK
jgi:hypothetical protein